MYETKYNRAATNALPSDTSDTFRSDAEHYHSVLLNAQYGTKKSVELQEATDEDLVQAVGKEGSVIPFSTVTDERREMDKQIQELKCANENVAQAIQHGLQEYRQLNTFVNCLHVQNESDLPYSVGDSVPIMCLKKRVRELEIAEEHDAARQLRRRQQILETILERLD